MMTGADMGETTGEPEGQTGGEDWLGFAVEDDDSVWVIEPDGEHYWHGVKTPGFFQQLVTAGFPLQLTSREPDAALFVDFSIKPSRLPVADVTAYSQGPAPREHWMGEAGAVVAEWLRANPDERWSR